MSSISTAGRGLTSSMTSAESTFGTGVKEAAGIVITIVGTAKT